MNNMQSQQTDIAPDEAMAPFSEPTRAWFVRAFGEPTRPQALGWPAIRRGENVLILAPTGSGKTLTAFLWGIDALYRELTSSLPADSREERGIHILYVSPLKALNNDVNRNLRVPLSGIRWTAEKMGHPFPDIEVSIRSGDTPQKERRAVLRRPPHIFITTPESLYLMLTSPRAREILRTTRTVILDEIHTLVGAKRGVHLSLSLERLEELAENPLQRIGLSATVSPLQEAARFLGGGTWQKDSLTPRPVTIVDAHYHKNLDLEIVSPVEDFRHLPGNSVWPVLIPQVLDLVRRHRTTLVFCNGRRLAERTANRLNEQWAAEEEGRPSPLLQNGVADGLGLFATGVGIHQGPVRAHHGSVSREARLEMERDLKAGNLPALVATSSLELGIDIGTVDLVVQLQSPRSVAQGLQRVGRSGHLVGQTSKGRFFPTYRNEIMEMAAIAGGMIRGQVEQTHTPRNSLDVLAQHIVAMVSVAPRDIEGVFRLVRRAYAYHDLTWEVYLSVLEMLSGRYAQHARRELQARLVWDRVNNVLQALPGSRMLAITNGGTIPDRGSFAAYQQDGRVRLGELDEEFVYETRIGDVFMLGSQNWRVTDITEDRILVSPAPGTVPRMPFWHGDLPWRPYELGRSIGEFWRHVAEALRREIPENVPFRDILKTRAQGNVCPVVEHLKSEYALDENAAWQVVDLVAGQLDALGIVASDQALVIETFEDAVGTAHIVIQSPFGGRVNGPWGLALSSLLRDRTGADLLVQTNDDGILLRLPDDEDDILAERGKGLAALASFIAQMTPAEARERILIELPESALFGARFRQNASRALLLPGSRPGKRTPFWLQRLRARDLLQLVRQYPEFPIVIETYRDCLEDAMDLPHLEEILGRIQSGQLEFITVESRTPSPVAASLVSQFTDAHMYEWDTPKAERQLRQLAVNRDLLQDVLKGISVSELLRPEAVEAVTSHIRHTAPDARARTADELALVFEQMGDLSRDEIEARTAENPADWIRQLQNEGRILPFVFPTLPPITRWIDASYVTEYKLAFSPSTGSEQDSSACGRILTRFLEHEGPLSVKAIQARYPFPMPWLKSEMDRRVAEGILARGRFTPVGPKSPDRVPRTEEYLDRYNLDQMHRRTLSMLRREVKPVSYATYAGFVARWQHVHPGDSLRGEGALIQSLQQLRAIPIVGRIWERDVWPVRLESYHPAELEYLCQSGEVVWVCSGGLDPKRSRVRFLFRGEGNIYLDPPMDVEQLSADAQAIHHLLKHEGALFWADLQAALGTAQSAWTVQQLENALLELVMNGWVTNDSIQAMRYIVTVGHLTQDPEPAPSGGRATGDGIAAPSLLSYRQGRQWGLRRPGPAEFRSAKKRVAQRLGISGAKGGLSQGAGMEKHGLQVGRWGLVHRLGILGRQVSGQDIAAFHARLLLQRWGVLTRQVLEAEAGSWDWEQIVSHLYLMEMRGEIRRGYFVNGLPGLQFALPEAVEQLRMLRDLPPDLDNELAIVNACDPANLYGPRLDDGPAAYNGQPLTFARVPSTWLVQSEGFPVLVARNAGASMSTAKGASEELVRRGLQTFLSHMRPFQYRVTINTWNERPVLQSESGPILESLGFYRDYPGMTWERE